MPKKRADGYFKKCFTIAGKQYTVYARDKKELFKKEQAKRAEIEAGFEKRENPTVNEYYERWTEARRGTVKESTIRGQIQMFNMISDIYIPSAKRRFGELKIKDVSIDDLRLVQSELLKSRQTQTVNDYMAHFNHCMRDAIKERTIDYNPCCLLKPLKRTEERARDTTHRALSHDEEKRFFECERCKKSYYYNVYKFALCTGMRTGEIGALKKRDIHNGNIHVERTITRAEAGNYIIGDDAKTEAGRRTIPMNDTIKEILDSQNELNAVLDGENIVSIDDLVFKAPERGLLMATPIDREIKRICKVCGIEPFTMHAFRDTFATRCIESGMNPKTLQEILGHSNFNITMSLYGHCLANTKKQEMDRVIFAI